MYKFTKEQLSRLLIEYLELEREYFEKHGYPPDNSKSQAVFDTLEGLDAERELVDCGELDQATMQVYDSRLSSRTTRGADLAVCRACGGEITNHDTLRDECPGG